MKHPGFKAVASGMAKKQGISTKEASRELAYSSMHASVKAKKANPRLNRVGGGFAHRAMKQSGHS